MREIQGECLVPVEARRHELRQANRVKEATRHATGEGFPEASEHRKASPKRIARGGVGIDRERVEEQVGETMARQMLRQRKPIGEDEAARVDATRRSLSAQIPLGGRVVAQQPQNTALDFLKKPHPDVE